MEKLDLILEKIDKIDSDVGSLRSDNKDIHNKLERLDKIDSVISSIRSDNKDLHKKLDVITNELADIKEILTDHDVKIQAINKTKAR